MRTKIISITKPLIDECDSAEDLIAYCARVSNPSNQANKETAPKLLKYLTKNKHWSPYEMASMCVEIKTTRAIAAQILRHRSFSFQEFSQRYSAVTDQGLNYPEMRYKADVNRQSSSEIAPLEIQDIAHTAIDAAFDVYDELLCDGVATETARMVLPLCTPTTLYMNGTLRSWIHYLELRCDEHTQKEHREIANEIKEWLGVYFPTIYEGVFNEG